MEKKQNEKLRRKITHKGYKYKNKLFDKGLQSWLRKEIIPFEEDFLKKRSFRLSSDEFIKAHSVPYVGPIIIGGLFLFLDGYAIHSIFFSKLANADDAFAYWLLGVSSSILLLLIAYVITMPKKEIILNRMEGTITFPGFMWHKNITMRFDDIKFAYTGGGSNGVGAYQLQIVRPDRFGTMQLFPMGGMHCYEDLAYITWYMDKSRPLPPMEVFEPYREKDFQRRKRAGFRKPMYPSQIPTPEDTPEQQAERQRIGKW